MAVNIYKLLNTLPEGTVILRNAEGWVVANGFQVVLGQFLAQTIEEFLQKEDTRKNTNE